jgi:hypothetical protein
MRHARSVLFLASALLLLSVPARAADCIACHEKSSPQIVVDWKLSKHAGNDVGCEACHGDGHTTMTDAAKATLPTPETCEVCHEARVAQFKRGKHALAWVSMNAMPTIHAQPVALIAGMKGCGGCHKIGTKTEADLKAIAAGGGRLHGNASCDACHTRHTFSVKEARQPQACQTCHMGFDHPQWEMYSASKHGVRYLLKQNGTLPEGTPAPTCQTCHMPSGDHEVRAPWGFLAVRLPLPEDPQWKADRITILQGLQVLDPDGKPTARLDAVKAADIARLDEASWVQGRAKMVAVCTQCHSADFATGELKKGDDMIREADHLMAEAIRVVAGLYTDGVIPKPAGAGLAFPDLLTFHDAANPIEQRLFVMFLEHRMRAFQGTFHANPDYALWYGWSEMRRDLTEIRHMAEEMRAAKARKG